MPFTKVLKLFLVWQLAILVVISISGQLFTRRDIHLGGLEKRSAFNPDPVGRNPYIYARGNFDGIHYIDIAKKQSRGVGQTAFFPLYPNLIHLTTPIFQDSTIAAITISSVSFLIGLYFFARLVELDFDRSVSFWATLSLLIFPVSFFFSAVYTEGLFFMLLITSFYAARKQKWFLAVILAALATYTRLVGIFLLPAFLLEMIIQFRQQRISSKSFPKVLSFLAIVPLGLFAFMFYLKDTTGDPLAFYHIQSLFEQGRSEKIVLIYQVFWRYVKMLLTVNRQDPLYLTIMLEFATGVVLSAVSVYSFVRHRASYALFNICSFILPTLTGTFTSLPRYALLCFPMFIFFGEIMSRLSLARRTLFLSIVGFLFLVFTSMFFRGYWVA